VNHESRPDADPRLTRRELFSPTALVAALRWLGDRLRDFAITVVRVAAGPSVETPATAFPRVHRDPPPGASRLPDRPTGDHLPRMGDPAP
jgi:hypothetical protein